MTVILIEKLTKWYGAHRAVHQLELKVPEGSLFGFIGPNGAGKTTTIRALLGLLRASSGQARIFGLDCWRASKEIKKRVGYLPGDLMLPSWLTTRNALKMLSLLHKRDLSSDGLRLAELFKLNVSVRVRQMSRGMRQKLGLIIAMAHEPELLILDEPTTGLDPLTQDLLCRQLRQLAQKGHTVFFSSHVLSEVDDLCDRVAIIRQGEIVENEKLDALRALAKRQVKLRWQPGSSETHSDPPSFLEVTRRENDLWSCFLDGPVPLLLDWLHGREVLDLTIGPPDLDSLFRSYYTEEEAL